MAQDFRLYLQGVFSERCKKNSSYSLRAFAKSLSIDNSTLAKIMNGKRKLGKRAIQNFGDRLGLSPKEIQPYLDIEQKEESDLNVVQVEQDQFQIIADWYHYAILELMQLKDFQTKPQWIARELGITKSEAQFAIERLQRAELLEIDSEGIWHDLSVGKTTNISKGKTSTAQRNLQKEILEKGIEAIDEVPLEERNNTSMTFAIDVEKMAEAQEEIKRFRRRMARLLTESENKTAVYNLGIALYPLTKNQRKNKEVNI